jgi:hypothetical protein
MLCAREVFMNQFGSSKSSLTLRCLASAFAVRALVTGLFFLGTMLAAQTTATILGTVKDQSGAVLPGAEITATNTETGISRVTVVGARGEYRLVAMPVGSYTVQASMTGFQSELRNGITLSIGREALVDFTLSVGNVSEQVTVTGEAPLIETTTATVSGLIDPKQMRDIPLNARSFIELVPLQAGAVYSESGEKSASKGFGVKVSISGARYNGNAFLLDGANINDMAGSAGSAAGTLAGVETVREFKIITNAFDAEYGNHVGGIISAVTKSGTNSLHGSLFEFFRNDKLDAPDFDDNRLAGGEKPAYRRNQFGGALGGPVRRDSLFFFGSYEALRESLGETGEYLVPGPELRQGCVPVTSGSSPNIVRASYNCYNAAGAPSAVPLGGTLSGVVNPRTKPFMDLYPEANTPCSANCFAGNPFYSANGTGNFTRAESKITNQNFITARGDVRLSDADSFFGRYTQDIADVTDPHFETAEISSTHNRYITLEETHVYSPNLLGRTHFSFVRTPMGLHDVSLKSLGLADYELLACASCTGSTNSFTGNDVPGAVTITGNPIASTGGDSTNPKVHNLNTYQFQEGITYSVGRQSLKFGGSFQRNQFNQRSDFFSGGSFGFSNLDDFIIANVNTFSTTAPGSDNNRGWRMNLMGMYLQDDINMRPGLTLNLGVRYEFITTPKEVNGKVSQIRRLDDSYFYNVRPEQTDVGDPFFLNPSLKNIAPRIGVAWTPFAGGKTAIRAGAGIFYEQLTQGLFQTGGVRLAPFYSAAVLSQATFREATGVPISFPDAYQTQNSLLTRGGGLPQADGFQWDADQPTVYKFSVTVQQQLLRDTTLEVGYAGTRGVHNTRGNMLLNTTPVNEVPELHREFIFVEQPLSNPYWDRMRWRMTDGTSWYNALLLTVSKRFSHGFQVQSSYTFSKSLDDSSTFSGSSDFGGTDVLGVRRQHWKGRSAFDVTQSWSTSFQYDLPGRTMPGVAGKILGGWNIGGVLRAFSGNPVTPTATRSALNRLGTGALTGNGGTTTCTAAQRTQGCVTNTITYVAGASVDLAPGVDKLKISPGSRTQYFDPADLAWPATFQNGTAPLNYPGAGRNGVAGGLVAIGNIGRNVITVPGNFNLDLSLRKDTAMPMLGEQGKMEFRFELFNAPNHTRLGIPGTALFNNRGEPNVNAGIISDSRGNSRQIQLSLRMVF